MHTQDRQACPFIGTQACTHNIGMNAETSTCVQPCTWADDIHAYTDNTDRQVSMLSLSLYLTHTHCGRQTYSISWKAAAWCRVGDSCMSGPAETPAASDSEIPKTAQFQSDCRAQCAPQLKFCLFYIPIRGTYSKATLQSKCPQILTGAHRQAHRYPWMP